MDSTQKGFMAKIQAVLEKYVVPVATKISQQRHLAAVRDGLTVLVPVTIIGGDVYKRQIIASSIAGALSMYFQCGQAFPHGGIWTIFLINNPIYFISSLMISLIIGTLLIAIMNKLKLKA